MQYCINWGKWKGRLRTNFLHCNDSFDCKKFRSNPGYPCFTPGCIERFGEDFLVMRCGCRHGTYNPYSLKGDEEVDMYKHWTQAYTKFSMARLYTNVTNAFSQWGPNAADAVEASHAAKVRTVPDVEMLSQPVSRCFKYIESTIHGIKM